MTKRGQDTILLAVLLSVAAIAGITMYAVLGVLSVAP